jgi:hypothetical protein
MSRRIFPCLASALLPLVVSALPQLWVKLTQFPKEGYLESLKLLPQLNVRLTDDVRTAPVPEDFVSISLETKCLGALWNTFENVPRQSYSRLMTLLQSQSNGRGPNIRIGGDSSDYTAYLPDVSPLPLGISYSFKDSDFSAMQAVSLFNGTITLGLNFLSPFWYNNTVFPGGSGPNGTAYGLATLQALVAHGIALDSPLLDSIELGNEPDIFWMVVARPIGYSPYAFNQESASYIQALQRTFPEYDFLKRPIIQAGVLCCQGSDGFNSTWLPSYLKELLPYSKSFSYHNYPWNRIVDPWVSVYSLLSVDAISQNYENWTIAAIQEVNQQGQGRIPFVVGEGNSIGSGGKANVSDVYGAALWSIDQAFYMASLGIQRWNVHGCDKSGLYSPVIYKEGPGVPDTPQVQPVFYGMWATSQAMRKQARLTKSEISGDAASNSLISVWSVLDGEGMRRAVVLNKDANATVATNVTVSLPPPFAVGHRVDAPPTALLYRLKTTSSLGVLATNGIVFANQTFDGNTDGSPVGARTAEAVSFDSALQGYNFLVDPAEAVILEIPAF